MLALLTRYLPSIKSRCASFWGFLPANVNSKLYKACLKSNARIVRIQKVLIIMRNKSYSPSIWSHPHSIHTCQRSGSFWIPFRSRSLLRWRISRITASKSSSRLLKRVPRSGSFNFRKWPKSGGLKLGLKGGWWSVFHVLGPCTKGSLSLGETPVLTNSEWMNFPLVFQLVGCVSPLYPIICQSFHF